ncbi:hypothetical protein [Rothia dentocariosa]|uniref:hypothetical protein n=1 Tax=Rothia dentocariosa TaxID=2047 RepID=UPI002152CAC8|nr:hypothetical protein [Rothia dentocariosa]
MFRSPRQIGIRYQKTAKPAGAMGAEKRRDIPHGEDTTCTHHRGRIPQENRDYRPRYGISTAATAHTLYLESVK